MPNGHTIPERITALEVKITEIATNHLPHLEAKVDRLTWLLTTTAVGVAVSIGLIVLK